MALIHNENHNHNHSEVNMKKRAGFLILFAFLCTFLIATEEITLQKHNPFTYVYLEITDTSVSMDSAIGTFMGHFSSQGLNASGPFLAVYHSLVANESKWRVGFISDAEAKPTPPLQLETFIGGQALTVQIKGPYDQLPKIYESLIAYMNEHKLTMVLPYYELYLNDPQTVVPAEIQTEIIIPVVNKQ